MLIDRSDNKVVGSTDPITRTVYISNMLTGDFYKKVLLHELGHCVMIAYGLLDEIHSFVPQAYWIDAEEWICNYLADYGRLIFDAARLIINPVL